MTIAITSMQVTQITRQRQGAREESQEGRTRTTVASRCIRKVHEHICFQQKWIYRPALMTVFTQHFRKLDYCLSQSMTGVLKKPTEPPG